MVPYTCNPSLWKDQTDFETHLRYLVMPCLYTPENATNKQIKKGVNVNKKGVGCSERGSLFGGRGEGVARNGVLGCCKAALEGEGRGSLKSYCVQH